MAVERSQEADQGGWRRGSASPPTASGSPAAVDPISGRTPGADGTRSRHQVRLVIFDFDGVLVDTADDITHAANQLLAEHRRPPARPDLVRRLIGGGAEGLVRHLLPEVDGAAAAAAAQRFKEYYGACYDQRSRLYPGVTPTLARLRAAGLLLAVATNKVEAITIDLIDKLGIGGYFAAVVGAESVGRRKPDPESLCLILERLRVAPSQAIMVGDTAADIVAGRAAGMPTCADLGGYGTPGEIRAAGPDHAISSIDELPGLLGLADLPAQSNPVSW